MPNINSLTYSAMSELTAFPVVSGTVVGLSGIARDEEFGLIIDTNNFQTSTAPFTITAGDYQNAQDYTITLTQDKIYALGMFDGSKYRQNDGSVNVSCNASGTIYAYSK